MKIVASLQRFATEVGERDDRLATALCVDGTCDVCHGGLSAPKICRQRPSFHDRCGWVAGIMTPMAK